MNESYAWKYFSVPDENGTCKWLYQQSKMRRVLANEEIFQLGYEWYEHPGFSEYHFKEGVDFFEKNVDEFMFSLGYEHDRTKHSYKAPKENNDRVVIFAHEGIGSVFLSMLLDIPYSIFIAHYAMTHTGMTVIEFENSGSDIIPRILSFSNDSHIYKEGLPTRYCNETPF